jgi:hypothetical protein
VKFIGAHRESWGVEPICKTLQVAPSTYYAVLAREPCARQLSDQRLKIEIARVHRNNFSVYGIEKVWRQLNREGHNGWSARGNADDFHAGKTKASFAPRVGATCFSRTWRFQLHGSPASSDSVPGPACSDTRDSGRRRMAFRGPA